MSTYPSYFSTTNDIKKAKTDMAIIPIGSVEQHGSHLPVGTDYFIADALGKAVAEKLGAYLLPTLPISTCYEHRGSAGTVGLKPETFMHMLEDIILCLKDQGYKRIVCILGHGGIFAAAPIIRQLNALNDDLQVIKIEPPSTPAMKALETGDPANELHAGEEETSVILYLQEETVKQDEMVKNDFVPKVPREYMNYAPVPVLSPTGTWGCPSQATKEKGEKMFNLMVEHCLNYIQDAFKVCKKDTWQK